MKVAWEGEVVSVQPKNTVWRHLLDNRTHRRTFETREQAQLEIFEYIETFYNRLRMHSALGFMSPVEFEEKMAKEKEEEIAENAAKAA